MSENKGCSCGCSANKTRLLYSCSGAADVGKFADELTRKLAKDNWGKMTCLAAMGVELSGFVESAKSVNENIVIDGCSAGCGKKIFEKLNIPYSSLVLTDMGLEKGKTQITPELLDSIAVKIKL